LKTSNIRVLIQFAVHSGALQGLQPSSASRSVNNNVVLSSFGGRGSAAAAAGRLTAWGEAVSAETTATEPATAPAGRATDAAADLTAVVAPSAVVSGGMMTLPTAQRHVSVNGAGVGTRVSPWQRGPAPTGPGRRLTGGGGTKFHIEVPVFLEILSEFPHNTAVGSNRAKNCLRPSIRFV